jgi:hypothetical protein
MFGMDVLSAVCEGRLTKMAFEGFAECSLRLITDPQHRLAD